MINLTFLKSFLRRELEYRLLDISAVNSQLEVVFFSTSSVRCLSLIRSLTKYFRAVDQVLDFLILYWDILQPAISAEFRCRVWPDIFTANNQAGVIHGLVSILLLITIPKRLSLPMEDIRKLYIFLGYI